MLPENRSSAEIACESFITPGLAFHVCEAGAYPDHCLPRDPGRHSKSAPRWLAPGHSWTGPAQAPGPCGSSLLSLASCRAFGAHLVPGDVAWSVCCWFRTERSFGSATATGLKPMARPRWIRIQDFWFWGQYSHTGTQPHCLHDGEKAKRWSRLGEKAPHGEETRETETPW